MQKAMTAHSSPLAWKIPWMEEPGGLQSMGSLGVGHDWVTLLSLFTFMHWRRKWQPTPVFLPGESQGQRSLVGCHLWRRTEMDMTEVTWQHSWLTMLWQFQVVSKGTQPMQLTLDTLLSVGLVSVNTSHVRSTPSLSLLLLLCISALSGRAPPNSTDWHEIILVYMKA